MDLALRKAETRTADLGGKLGTKAFGDVVAKRLDESAEKLAKA